MDMNAKEMEVVNVDELVANYGAPLHLETDDSEAWYWKFSDRDLPVADDLSELLRAGWQMLQREQHEASFASPEIGDANETLRID
jgi:hypothetical protein